MEASDEVGRCRDHGVAAAAAASGADRRQGLKDEKKEENCGGDEAER